MLTPPPPRLLALVDVTGRLWPAERGRWAGGGVDSLQLEPDRTYVLSREGEAEGGFSIYSAV